MPDRDELYRRSIFALPHGESAAEHLVRLEFRYQYGEDLPPVQDRERGSCRHCGYDISHIASSRCPECGAPVGLVQSLPEVEARRHLDDEAAKQLIPRTESALAIYDLMRECCWPPIWAACAAFRVEIVLRGRPMNDDAALALLPKSQRCRQLYEQHRELGRAPMWVLRTLMPHLRTFAP